MYIDLNSLTLICLHAHIFDAPSTTAIVCGSPPYGIQLAQRSLAVCMVAYCAALPEVNLLSEGGGLAHGPPMLWILTLSFANLHR